MSESNEEILIVHIPSLVATLLDAERKKGTQLTEAEVLEIRDTAPAVAIRPGDLPALISRRGYHDLDPENCWEEWQAERGDLLSSDD